MTSTLANVAVPIFFPHPVVALLALFPVVGVEAVVLRRRLGLNTGEVFAANLFSAALGCVLAFLCIVLLGAGFNIFLSRDGTTLPQVLLMMGAVVVPCFILSILLEGAYLRSHAEGAENRAFWFAVIKAHCYSYLVLVGLDCLWISIKIS